jgi:ABC-2 type transport system permease protein
VSSFYGSKFQRNIEEMMVAPVPAWVVLCGFVAGGVARGLVVGIAVTAVAMFFADLRVHSPLVLFSTVILTSILFSLTGFINGVYAKSFDDISIIPTFVLTPLTYLGGVFYSISLLPEFWQKASLLNPILYMVNAFRYGFLGVSDISLYASYSIALGFIIMLYLVSLRLLKRGTGIRS